MEWQPVAIPLRAGMDTKTDAKRLIPGKLVLLENGQFDDIGEISKRTGFTTLAATRLAEQGDDGTNPLEIATIRDIYESNGHLYAMGYVWVSAGDVGDARSARPCVMRWVDDQSGWAIMPSSAQALQVTKEQVLSAYEISDMAYDANATHSVVARLYWSGSSSRILEYVIRTADGDILESGTYPISSGRTVRVLLFSDCAWFVIGADDSPDVIYMYRYDLTLVNGLDTSAVSFSTTNYNSVDIARVSDSQFVLIHKSTSTDIEIKYLATSDGSTDSSATIAIGATVATLLTVEYLSISGTTRTCVAYGLTGTGDTILKALNGTTVTDTMTIQSGTGNGRITMCETTLGDQAAAIFVAVGATEGILMATFEAFGGSVTGIATEFSNCDLVSEAFDANFVRNDGATFGASPHFWIRSNSADTSDRTLLLVNQHQVVARVLSQRALPGGTHTQPVIETATGEWTCLVSEETVIDQESYSSQNAVVGVLLTIKSAPALTSVELSSGRFIPGAVGMWAAGRTIGELGFLHGVPELTYSSGHIHATNSYTFKGVWEAIDDLGNLHRSAPSAVVTDSGGSVATLVFTADDMPLLPDRSSAGDYYPTKMAIFGTEASGVIYYRVKTFVLSSDFRSTGATSSTLSGVTAGVSTNEILYTEGGELEAYAPPPSRHAWTDGTRLFVVATDESSVWPSKPFVDRIAPEFNSLLSIRFPETPYAGASMLGNQIVFCTNSIWVFSGEGPNALGQGNFSVPRKIAEGIGTVDPASVLSTPQGVLFRTDKGYQLIDRSLGLQPGIGLGVDTYKTNDVSSAWLDGAKNKAMFLLHNGRILMYDYLLGEWATHLLATGLTAVRTGAAMVGGALHVLVQEADGDYVVMKANSSYTDNSTAYSLKVQTGWIPLAQHLGANARVRRFSLVGDKKSDHTLTVRVYYDYSSTVAETFTFDASVLSTGPYLVRARLAKQKASAIRFEIEDSANSGTEGYSISEIVLEALLRKGTAKLPKAQTMVGA